MAIVLPSHLLTDGTDAMPIVLPSHLLTDGADAMAIMLPSHLLTDGTDAMAIMLPSHFHLNLSSQGATIMIHYDYYGGNGPTFMNPLCRTRSTRFWSSVGLV